METRSQFTGPDATPAGAVVAERSGVTAGETAPAPDLNELRGAIRLAKESRSRTLWMPLEYAERLLALAEGSFFMSQDQNSEGRALMALFDPGHRLELPSGYWLRKDSDNQWQIGKNGMYEAMLISGTAPVGRGGSMDSAVKAFADAMSARITSVKDS